MLAVYAALARRGPQRLVPTYLGAHVVPPEYRDRRGATCELVRAGHRRLVADEGLARFVDVFVEERRVHRGRGPAAGGGRARRPGWA